MVYWTHSWLGLISGVFLLVISLTGVVLLFHDQMDAALDPSLTRVHVRSSRLPYDELLMDFSQQNIPGHLESLSLPQNAEDPLLLGVRDRSGYHKAWMDPYTGQLLGYGGDRATTSGWIDSLHYQLLAGDYGEVWAGLVAFVLVLASATGLYIQGRFLVVLLRWPRARARMRDSHSLIGTWMLLASILFGLTGTWLCRFGLLRLIQKPQVAVDAQQRHVADLYLRELARLPNFTPTLVLYPDKAGGAVEVAGVARLTRKNWLYGTFAYRVTLDAGTGRIVSFFDPTRASLLDTSDNWIFAIHSAQFAIETPLWLKLLYTILGLSPAVLAVTGYLLYIRRLARKRRLRSRQFLEWRIA
jgi:uncharacterized iron-regulated membrane protein